MRVTVIAFNERGEVIATFEASDFMKVTKAPRSAFIQNWVEELRSKGWNLELKYEVKKRGKWVEI